MICDSDIRPILPYWQALSPKALFVRLHLPTSRWEESLGAANSLDGIFLGSRRKDGGGGLLVGERAAEGGTVLEDRGLSLTSSTTRDGLPA